jgi:hypothetical protein
MEMFAWKRTSRVCKQLKGTVLQLKITLFMGVTRVVGATAWGITSQKTCHLHIHHHDKHQILHWIKVKGIEQFWMENNSSET